MSLSKKAKVIFKRVVSSQYNIGYLTNNDILEFIAEGSLDKEDYQDLTGKPYPKAVSSDSVTNTGDTGSNTSAGSNTAKNSVGTSSTGNAVATSAGSSSSSTTSSSSASSTGVSTKSITPDSSGKGNSSKKSKTKK